MERNNHKGKSMELFFYPELINGIVELDETEARHVRVLRKRVGDMLMLIDGKGHRSDAMIVELSQRQILLQLDNVEYFEKQSTRLVLGVSPLKNPDRFEWLVEKCTESGVDTIVPIVCDRTEAALKKTDRLQRIMRSATTQSLQYYMPELAPPISYAEFFRQYKAEKQLIAWCDDAEKQSLLSALPAGSNAAILIGPEGDFTKAEFELAISNGFEAISMGQNRLRTETAAVFAAQAFYLINQ